ncbi:MAG: glycosyltransferase [Gemmatimonadaceae bacterium]
MMKRRVSVIITAHDAEATIREPLRALALQQLPDDVEMDIIVVDDRCSDDTARRARQAAANASLSLRVVQISTPPLAGSTARQAALDAGLALSSSEHVLLLDADATPAPMWVSAMLEGLDRSDVVAGAIRFRPTPGGVRNRVFASLQSVDAAYYHGVCALVAASGRPTGVCFGAAAMRRSALLQVGALSALGFTLTEDLDFARASHAQGLRIGFAPRPSVAVHGAPSLHALRERALRVSATGGVSVLAMALALPIATLPIIAVGAITGLLSWWLLLGRMALGAVGLLLALRRTGSGDDAWPAALVYEWCACLMAIAIAIHSRGTRVVKWGGVEYSREVALSVARDGARR